MLVAPSGRPSASAPLAVPVQAGLDELGTPLADVTFVVVDLETTGASAAVDAITEVGAVKVRGGELLGEFSTLVRPDVPVPPFIAVLTGITDATVADAPRLEAVLPAFLEFAAGGVLVAHNAPFDVGFLRAACARLGHAWPAPPVVDTARLARAVVSRDEARDCKLATLARVFRSGTEPCHRALADARATVDVLHGLLERVGPLGVETLEELRGYSAVVSEEQRRKRHLADGLPAGPGVYLFRGPGDEVLYVGTSGDVRRRVRQYFLSSERRTRMAEMVGVAQRVDSVRCAHALEASVRELRLLAAHKPRYNRRSRTPERAAFIGLTREPFPRLSIVRALRDDGGPYLGPFPSRRAAEVVVEAVQDALPIRRCSRRLSPRRRTSPCALAGLGRCGAPCDGGQDVAAYAPVAEAARRVLAGDVAAAVEPLAARVERLAIEQRFEEAAVARDRLAALVSAAERRQRLAAMAACPELVAARRDGGGWDLVVVRHGRLAAAGVAGPGVDPWPVVEALRLSAEHVEAPVGGLPAAGAEETDLVLRWLRGDGVRLVAIVGTWCSPLPGAGRYTRWSRAGRAARRAAAPLDDTRRLRPDARPPGRPRASGAPPGPPRTRLRP